SGPGRLSGSVSGPAAASFRRPPRQSAGGGRQTPTERAWGLASVGTGSRLVQTEAAVEFPSGMRAAAERRALLGAGSPDLTRRLRVGELSPNRGGCSPISA